MADTDRLVVNAVAPEAVAQVKLSVFQQSWWLAIANRQADFHELVVVKDQTTVGSLSFIVKRFSFGVRWGSDAHWSRLGGPVVSENLDDKTKAAVLDQLIARLPPRISFSFLCGPHTSYADLIRAAFVKAGFEHSTVLTYLRVPGDGAILSGLKRKPRLHIKAANKHLEVLEISATEFVNFYNANLKMMQIAESFAPLDIARALIEEGCARRQVRVIAARRKMEASDIAILEDGKDVPYDAAIACAWDNERYYYWMSTRRIPRRGNVEAKPHPDAIKLLAVRAIEHAESLGLIFDADGVNTPGTEHLYRDILKLPRVEVRDRFQRVTGLARLYKRHRDIIHRVATRLGLRHILRPKKPLL